MITITKDGNAIKFTFVNNEHYLTNGEIEVPLNSLSLVTDDSGMASFKRSATNDTFISATYEELGMSKADLESWYKENMVGETGGGGDITSGEVQTMIDESISGKADSSAVTEEISAAVSGKADISDIPDVSNYFDGAEYDSGTTRINFYHGNTVKAYIDASAFIVDGMIDDVRIETISGVTYLVIDFNTASGKEDIQIPITDIFDASNYYNKSEIDSIVSGLNDSIDEKLDASAYTPTDLSEYWTSAQTETAISNATSGKADTSAVTEEISAAVSGKVDTSTFETYSGSVDVSLSGKVDTSAITSSVTSASTDSEVPTAKAVHDAISAGGGGKAIEAGRGISVTTGETADTVSFNLPISAGTGSNSIVICGDYKPSERATASGAIALNGVGFLPTYATGANSLAIGQNTNSIGRCSLAGGQNSKSSGESSFSFGSWDKTKNYTEASFGNNNKSAFLSDDFGNSGNTLFSVGNGIGISDSTSHNAFEVRQNGDIYIADTNDTTTNNYYEKPMIKLQDHLGGGGGIDSGTVQTMIDESISGKADTSAVTESINAAVSGKQDTLSAGTGIEISGNVISATGGGGATYSAGTNISIDSANTISCTLPITVDSTHKVYNFGTNTLQNLYNAFVYGYDNNFTRLDSSNFTDYNIIGCYNSGKGSVLNIFGRGNTITHTNSSRGSIACTIIGSGNTSSDNGQYNNSNRTIIGNGNIISGSSNVTAIGNNLVCGSAYETALGRYNKSVTEDVSQISHSGNTLFSVGNGTSSARHNAFEIRQNGDIYITKDGQDVKLQDQLGGGGGLDDDTQLLLSTALTDLNDRKADLSEVKQNYQRKGDYATKSELAAKANVSDVMTLEKAKENEQVTSYALNNLNNRVTDNTTALGGMKLVKLTQSEYAALTTKDENTLYVVIADPE